jgi:PAS domain S-box-containing protein
MNKNEPYGETLLQGQQLKISLFQALEDMEDGLYTLDQDWKFIYLNDIALKSVNKTREELIGRVIWDISPHILNHPFHKILREAMSSQKITEVEDYFPFSGRWYKVKLFPSRDSVTIMYQDVTDLKAVREEMERSEKEFKFLADSIPQLVWSMRPNGDSDYFNSRWQEYLGYIPAENSQFDWAEIIHPDDLARAGQSWNEATETGKYETEYRLKDKEGCYHWFIARALPIRDNSGNIRKWFGTATDIDQQKRNDQKNKFLAEASNLLISSIDYQETLKNIARMAVPYFADWCTVDMVEDNEISRLAVAHQEPSKVELAKELFQRFRPKLDDPIGLPNVIRTGVSEFVPFLPDSVFSENPQLNQESQKIFRDLGLNSYMVVPLKSHDKVIGGISFVNDKTRLYTESDLAIAEDLAGRASLAINNALLYQESSKQKEELAQVNKELENFAYIASHDLSEPLRTITGYSQLLVKRYRDKLDQDGSEFIDLIVESSKRMRNLIEDLLSFSMLGAGKLNLVQLDLNQIMENVLDNLKIAIQENQAKIIYDSLPALKAEPTLISQLFQNLIGNAIKYRSATPPVINISWEKKDQEYMFKVSDNGIGIDPRFFDKVFVIFHRLKDKNDVKGSGIGLSTSKKIVGLHGGQIWVESEPGKGTTFCFTLPA